MRKKLPRLALLLASLFVLAGVSEAHPAKDMVLTMENGLLGVMASHGVSDGKEHYIRYFTVRIGGEMIYRLEASRQPDRNDAMGLFYLGTLKKGTVVDVETECSRSGTLRKSITVK